MRTGWQLMGTLALVLALSGTVTGAQPANEATGFTLVGRHDLGARGMNAGLAIAGDCAYVGSRSADQGTVILDIAEPAAPRVTGELPPLLGSTPREVRASADLGLLVILHYRLDPATAAVNALDLYDIAECQAPVWRGRFDLGAAMPHEFFLWRDPAPARAGRVLAYVAMWGHPQNLRVLDLTDPANPMQIATWDAGAAFGLPTRLHSLSVTPDGRQAYLADWDAGLMSLDTSALATGAPADGLDPIPLTPPAGRLVLPGGNLHSAVPVPGTDLVVTTQEIYGPGTCPYGRLHVVDVRDSALPAVVGAVGIAENDPAACPATATLDGAFTTHAPLVVAEIAFVSWYAGGLRAVDLADPAAPAIVATFIPDPLPAVAADDLTLGSYPVRMWSYPIIRAGLLYVVDIRNGLYVLRYTGPRAEVVSRISLAEGNAT